MSESKVNYVLTLTEEQAKMISRACELYARLKMGQWNELIWECLDLGRVDFCEVRDKLEPLLMEARSLVWPKLGKQAGCSLGVGHDKKSDMVWEIHEVLRNKIAWHEHPEGGNGVCFGNPMSFSGEPLAKCEVKNQE